MKNCFGVLILAAWLLTINSCKKDTCVEAECLNGGYCENNACKCPPGYSGVNCSVPLDPTVVYITKIEVMKFLGMKNGVESWDVGSGADIYPVCMLPPNTELWSSPTWQTDAHPDSVYAFIPDTPIPLTDPNSSFGYVMYLYDYDGAGVREPAGQVNFNPFLSYWGWCPPTMEITYGTTKFKLYLTYGW